MKIIVTHTSPDWDAITSVWLIKRLLPGWQSAKVKFVPAGERVSGSSSKTPVEKIKDNEVIHVDTGLGPLDHHQTSDENVSAASLTWDLVKKQIVGGEHWADKKEAINRMVKVIVGIDHFREVFWEDPKIDYYKFSLQGLLDGLKLSRPDDDRYYTEFGMQCLDMQLHNFENKIWAEKEIAEKGKVFKTRFGKGLGIETINDDIIKLAQKMGFVLVVRKDPRKGYVRIKARPLSDKFHKPEIDLTYVYNKLKAVDSEATWFLHISKRMLLNGTVKNPKMVPTRLSLDDIIEVIKKI